MSISIIAQQLVASSGRPLILEAESKTSRIDGFIAEYSLEKGRALNSGEEDAIIDVGDENKRGVEYRIYFPHNTALKTQIESHKTVKVERGSCWHDNTHRINNRDLFWELVQIHGLVLGQNP